MCAPTPAANCHEKLAASVQGWANHARYANTIGLPKALLGKIIPNREE